MKKKINGALSMFGTYASMFEFKNKELWENKVFLNKEAEENRSKNIHFDKKIS